MSIVEGIQKFVLRPKRILIVEDDPDCSASIKACLRDYDCEFTEVTDGGTAIDTVAAQAFDLAFIDIKLPVCSGIEVLRYVKQHRPDMPVVMMSGYFNQDVLDQSLAEGVVTFIRKPVDFTKNWISDVLHMFNLKPVRSDEFVRRMALA